MSEDKTIRLKSPGTPGAVQDALTEVLREGARRLLASAIEVEVAAFLERFQAEKTDEGLSRMVRNGRRLCENAGSIAAKTGVSNLLGFSPAGFGAD